MTRKLVPWKRSQGSELPVRREENNPFLSLHRSMNELFDHFFRDFGGAFEQPAWSRASTALVSPSVDIAETDSEIAITADLPGLEEKDIEVSLDNDVLTIRGSRKEEREEKRKNYHLMERSYGSFQRTLHVPAGVDKDKVKASFKNGVLNVTLPKLPEAKAARRKIEISAG
jgi:HSP20 family protein